jgi:hypothetical protein
LLDLAEMTLNWCPPHCKDGARKPHPSLSVASSRGRHRQQSAGCVCRGGHDSWGALPGAEVRLPSRRRCLGISTGAFDGDCGACGLREHAYVAGSPGAAPLAGPIDRHRPSGLMPLIWEHVDPYESFDLDMTAKLPLRTAGQITASSFARNREQSCDRHTPSDSVIPPGVLS